MISYDLAKELKEAGWPQAQHVHAEGLYLLEPGSTAQLFLREEPRHDTAYAPSLSELIAACQKDEFGLLFEYGAWVAGYDIVSGYDGDLGRGATPEEAVARLWLKLKEGKV